jgi:hypothetical protein
VTAAVKITPAMREWCRRLVKPERCTLVNTSRLYYSTRGYSSIAPPNYPMVGRMEDAGLIAWREEPDPHSPGRTIKIAELTELGKQHAGK